MHFFRAGIVSAMLLATTPSFSQEYLRLMDDLQVNFYTAVQAAEDYFATHDNGKGSGYMDFLRWKAENEYRYYPSGDRSQTAPDFGAKAYKEFLAKNKVAAQKSLFPNGWNDLGPYSANNITEGYNPGIGRVESFWVDRANTQHIYMGARGGGFWKTLDGGATWTNTTDFLVAAGVNAIDVDPFDLKHVLINVRNGQNGYTHGIYFSDDYGDTWNESNFNPTTLGWGGLGSNAQINKIVYHPTQQDLVFICSNKGLFRSTNNLQTWTAVIANKDISDLEIDPNDLNYLYAYQRNQNVVQISQDTGLTFVASNDVTGNAGARGFITASLAEPHYLYFASSNGVWQSQDNGMNWTFLSNPDESCQGFAVSDITPNIMIYGYLNIERSGDGGQNFYQIVDWNTTNPGPNYTHADIRTLECYNGVFYVGTDGYLCKTSNNGASWERLNDGTGIREFYAIGLSQSNWKVQMGGSQDNGTSILDETGWIEWNGGDGMEAVVQPLNDEWMVGSWQYGTRQVTRNGGQTRLGANNPEGGSSEADWQAPLLVDPNEQMRVYHFGSSIYRADDFGFNWEIIGNPNIGIIKNAAIAENDNNIMVVARNEKIMLTTDGGATFTSIRGSLPNATITDIGFAPTNDSIIIVTYGTYQIDNKKVYISKDLGTTWTNITSNLGNLPIRSVVIDHSDSMNIYLGAEIGVYTKTMNGDTWQLYSTNLPNCSARDLEIQYGSNTLRAATYGRGLWEYHLVGRENYPAILTTNITDTPDDSYPKSGYDQYVTSTISYGGTVAAAFIKWSLNTPTFDQTISMSNTSDSTWKTDLPIVNYNAYNKIYFKVFAVGENQDTTETYKFMYTIKPGLQVGIIESDFEKNVSIYPNPTSGKFAVEIPEIGNSGAELSIVTVDGKLVYSEKVTSLVQLIDPKLSVGMYLVSIVANNKKAVIKLVVE